MTENMKIKIKVEATVDLKAKLVWDLWNTPQHVMQWNSASPDWHTPKAENNLKKGGRFLYRMEARDGSFGFDFEGTYDQIIDHEKIEYTLDDGRKVIITFREKNGRTHIEEEFEAEGTNPIEMQKNGWQAILNNFKGYAEKTGKK